MPIAALIAILCATAAGCGGNPEAESRVREAERLVESSKPLFDDLLDLDARLDELGTRFSNVDDTIAEGKSLAEMALVDVDELEARISRAIALLEEVAGMDGAGDYAEYAKLFLAALDPASRALARNRELLTAVWDMLDVLPSAESAEQLSYYTGEIDRLTAEINSLLREASNAAEAADRYREERDL
ncbi:MAG: hypothetical protein HPY75_00215 [Actinobacteria bacterium]|nr:hypothetical protein [Actinomycetota bacterium]